MRRYFKFNVNNKTEYKQAHTAKDVLKAYGIVLEGKETARAGKTYQNSDVMVSYQPVQEAEYKLNTFSFPEAAQGTSRRARLLRQRLRTQRLELYSQTRS